MKSFIRSNIEIFKLENEWSDVELCEQLQIDKALLNAVRNARRICDSSFTNYGYHETDGIEKRRPKYDGFPLYGSE